MNTRTRSALRASLKQEDAALDERLPEATRPAVKPPAELAAAVPERKPRKHSTPTQTATLGVTRLEPVTPTAAAAPHAPVGTRPGTRVPTQAAKPSQPEAEKRQRESFSLAASDLQRLAALRRALKTSVRPARKSELVRAGLAALAALDHADAIALLDVLPPLERTAGKGDQEVKRRKSKSPKHKSAARKR